jgi:hypothetical protein
MRIFIQLSIVYPVLMKKVRIQKGGEKKMSKTTYGKCGTKHVTSDKGSKTETWHYKGGKALGITHADKKSGKSHSHSVGHGILGPFVGSRKK